MASSKQNQGSAEAKLKRNGQNGGTPPTVPDPWNQDEAFDFWSDVGNREENFDQVPPSEQSTGSKFSGGHPAQDDKLAGVLEDLQELLSQKPSPSQTQPPPTMTEQDKARSLSPTLDLTQKIHKFQPGLDEDEVELPPSRISPESASPPEIASVAESVPPADSASPEPPIASAHPTTSPEAAKTPPPIDLAAIASFLSSRKGEKATTQQQDPVQSFTPDVTPSQPRGEGETLIAFPQKDEPDVKAENILPFQGKTPPREKVIPFQQKPPEEENLPSSEPETPTPETLVSPDLEPEQETLSPAEAASRLDTLLDAVFPLTEESPEDHPATPPPDPAREDQKEDRENQSSETVATSASPWANPFPTPPPPPPRKTVEEHKPSAPASQNGANSGARNGSRNGSDQNGRQKPTGTVRSGTKPFLRSQAKKKEDPLKSFRDLLLSPTPPPPPVEEEEDNLLDTPDLLLEASLEQLQGWAQERQATAAEREADLSPLVEDLEAELTPPMASVEEIEEITPPVRNREELTPPMAPVEEVEEITSPVGNREELTPPMAPVEEVEEITSPVGEQETVAEPPTVSHQEVVLEDELEPQIQTEPVPEQVMPPETISEVVSAPSEALDPPEMSSPSSPKAEEVVEAIQQQLERINQSDRQGDRKEELNEADFAQVRQLIGQLETKLSSLENQVYEPTEVINPLVPLMVQLLKMKVGVSQEAMTELLVPIIDDIIQQRVTQDQVAMSQALAQVLPLAIEQEIQRSPRAIARAIAPEIAAALQEQNKLERDAIPEALGPAMGRAIKAQIELERDAMVDALYPVVGNTISKYMGELVASINEKVDQTLSLSGVQRKIKARIQGVSEAELILQEASPVKVQAIFLIHKASGLVIAEMQPHGEQRLESNMIAGMLTAIRSFVNDCIAESGQIAELNEIEYGNSRIILEVAGYCYLAVAVEGNPSTAVVKHLRRTLGEITQKHGQLIEQYDGDRAGMPDSVTQALEQLEQKLQKSGQQKSPSALLTLLVILLIVVVLPWSYFQVRGFLDRRLESQIESALTDLENASYSQLTPTVNGKRVILSGRVPLEQVKADAEKMVAGINSNLEVDNQIIVVQIPPDPANVANTVAVVASLLNRSNNVNLTAGYQPGTVILRGNFNNPEDYKLIVESFDQIPGIETVNTAQLLPEFLRERVFFEMGSSRVPFGSLSNARVNQIRNFLAEYPEIGLRIIGHSDSAGPAQSNQELAMERAKNVQSVLLSQGLDPERLAINGTAEPPPEVETNDSADRSRVVRFELMPAPSASSLPAP
ncbi:OmpA family protein [Spirulina subsalsa FACHB-351]|uniref:OmpA family protein n=1 Tax=Spirulina subsalsa FACHB-351 TaxID=234711 RepID=A0ABT3L9M5_9CYAN|nr:OmpA family protein [Spirulina subsalsa]MCW6038211.1 OmpA family protein [Spirulina subsalsa FACHB-351]